MSEKNSGNPLAFELERDEIERGAVAAGLVEPDRGNLPRCKATNAKGEPCWTRWDQRSWSWTSRVSAAV